MESILLVIHVIVALVIVGLIMLQQGKGAEMGASFGAGASQTVFGSVGSGNFFSRLTGILVAVFFVTSFVLAVMASNSVAVDDLLIPELESVSEVPVAAPVSDEIPAAPAGASSDEVPTAE
jgi:preprotein translocase subunit SecG